MDFDIDTDALADALQVEVEEAELFAEMIAVAADHKRAALSAGFSPEAADSMAVALHSGLVARYFTQ